MTVPMQERLTRDNLHGVWAAPAMAVSTIATLPIAVIILFFQRYFVQGMVLSGLKG